MGSLKEATKQKDLVYKRLDDMYSSAVEIANEWEIKTMPLNTLKVIINGHKVSVKTNLEFVNIHNKQFNKTLDSLLKGCRAIAKKMNCTYVPLSELKKGIEIIKTAYEPKA